MRYLITFLLLISILTGCQQTPCSNAPTDTEPVVSPSAVIVDTEGVSCRKVESIGRISYEELEHLPNDKLLKLKEFEFEQCYFKMENIPTGMQEKYVSIWEVGLLAFYENPETDESIRFRWLAEKNPNNYIKDQESKKDIKKINRNNIDYYCDFANFTSNLDKDDLKQPYHVSIRWVEDDKCFYLKLKSDIPLCDSIVDICRLQKFMIGDAPN